MLIKCMCQRSEYKKRTNLTGAVLQQIGDDLTVPADHSLVKGRVELRHLISRVHGGPILDQVDHSLYSIAI